MPLSERFPAGGRPRKRVTLIVESSLASGRNIVRGVIRYARQHGPWLLHHEWRNTDMYFPPWLRDWEGDGIIARVESRKMARALKALRVPVVDVLGAFPIPGVPLVHVDDSAIGRMAAAHLLERGYRHFGFCGLEGFPWSEARGAAFAAAVGLEGYTCRIHAWRPRRRLPWSWEREQQAIMEWLLALPKPAGLMLCNDLHSHFVLEACRRGGIRVPEELAVIGVDDDESVCEICEPPLSSIRPDDEQVGIAAAQLLDRLMHGRAARKRATYIPPAGVHTRLSTDMLAVNDAAVAAAAGFIREHACQGLRAEDVVAAIPMSRTLLQRRFRRALGRSIHEEIERIQLDHACFLLSEGSMPISDVAEKSGFRHQSYLGAVFKRTLGVTPLQFRKKASTPAGRKA